MDFRKVTAIIQSETLEKVERALRVIGVPGVSVSSVKGYGEYKDFYAKELMTSHARVEIFIEQGRAEEVATTIMDAAHTGLDGDGIVAILPVESVYHIRTREKCSSHVC
jgi:nitrogen regulatory protein P-II 1